MRDEEREALHQQYERGQAACGLKIRDFVEITRKAISGENGWGTCWVPEMDKCVGLAGEIKCISPGAGYEVNVIYDDYNVRYWYPYFVLAKVGNL